MSITQFNFPTPIKFGAGSVKLISQLIEEQGYKRPLVVTDRAVSGLPFIKQIVDDLNNNNLVAQLYCDFEGNPVKSHVDNGTKVSREHGADAIVIVGGGAALDVGKTIAIMTNHPGDVFDYEDGNPDGRPVDQKVPFMIAVPTTAGTGSEVGRASVISEDDTKRKRIIFDPQMLPDVVIADPELTYGLPSSITASTGMDALTHNIEAYLAKGYHPICDGIALEGISLVAQHLESAVKSPKDFDARAGMLMASMMGAIAFQKGLGLTHSAAHALSTVFDMHHGLANALMLRACMEFNMESCPDRFEKMASAVGLESGPEFVKWTGEMLDSLNLPTGLKSQNVEISEKLLDVAFADPCHPLGPRSVTRDDFRKLYEASM